jgi:hypothetical protein
MIEQAASTTKRRVYSPVIADRIYQGNAASGIAP